jgi:epoxyqueuosine reductase
LIATSGIIGVDVDSRNSVQVWYRSQIETRASVIRERAIAAGFDLVGFAPVRQPAPGAPAFLDWLAAGHHGEMAYLARSDAVEKRLDPDKLLPGVQTALMLGVSYESLAVPAHILHDPMRGRIARYAWGADYHEALTPALRAFGASLADGTRGYVDTGPVLERGWAERAGLGFIGKNTCLITRDRGSFVFLGAVLLPFEVMDDAPAAYTPRLTCGSCTRCLDACPTAAFPAPGVLDARRCISYLTIELKDEIPEALRPRMGNWVFGCDICQDVCPYVRRFSRPSMSPLAGAFRPLDLDSVAPPLEVLLNLDTAQFRAKFAKTPLVRAKRRGLLRNACVAAGNARSRQLLPALSRLANDDEVLIRTHAAWAIMQIEV